MSGPWRWGLVASVALNLFLVALVATHLLSHPRGGRRMAPVMRIDSLAATLPAPDGDKLRAALQARSGEIGAALDRFRAAQDEVRARLRSEPFDLAALKRAMAEAQGRHQVMEAAIQDLIAGAAAEMSAAGRDKLAVWPRRP
jgi:uncharacterized membrane protein